MDQELPLSQILQNYKVVNVQPRNSSPHKKMSFEVPVERILNIKRRRVKRRESVDDGSSQKEERSHSPDEEGKVQNTGESDQILEEDQEQAQPEEELDPEVVAWLTRPVNSSEKRKRFFLEAAKFDMQEFFNDRDDDAK